MPGKRGKWLYAILSLCILLALLIGYAPLLLEELVLPPLLQRAGLEQYRIAVSRLGLSGCTLHISGREDFPPPVIAGTIRIAWSPRGLLEKKLEAVEGDSLQINLAALPPDTPDENAEDSRSGDPFPLLVDTLTINKSNLLVAANDTIVALPLALFVHKKTEDAEGGPEGAIRYEGRLQVAEQELQAVLEIDGSGSGFTGQLRGDIDLASLAILRLWKENLPEKLAGKGELSLDVSAAAGPFVLNSLDASLTIRELFVEAGRFRFSTSPDGRAMITARGKGMKYHINAGGIQLLEPLHSPLELDLNVARDEQALQWDGTLDLAPDGEVVLAENMLVKNIPSLHILSTGRVSGNVATLHVQSEAQPDNKKDLPLTVQLDKDTVVFAQFTFAADLSARTGEPEKSLTAKIDLQGRTVSVDFADGSFSLPKWRVEAECDMAPAQNSGQMQVNAVLDDAVLTMGARRLGFQAIRLELPFAMPLADATQEGSFMVEGITLNDELIGRIRAKLQQNEQRYDFSGTLQTSLTGNEGISLEGFAGLPDKGGTFSRLRLAMAEVQLAAADFVPFVPGLDGLAGSGRVGLQGEVSLSTCGIDGSAEASLKGGTLEFAEAEIELDDIDLMLSFPALPSLVTGPQQQLSIGEIRRQKMVLSDVVSSFQLESPDSLFIESISGNWVQGRVFASPFRLQKDQEQVAVAFICDRLELSAILSQLGLAKAEGEGKVSGRIPFLYKKGRYYIEEGFLFSTPGETGYLKVRQSSYLETAIPKDVPQFSPLHFAGAALADFEYNWAKLLINSQEENLLLQLQVDGKPRERLPYGYDPQKNAFVRLKDESKGGIDQPVKLDVNFSIPLNEMLQYKGLFQLFRQIK